MKLSYSKTVELLRKHSTEIVAIFLVRLSGCPEARCVFLECSVPTMIRTFFLSIPDRFSLVVAPPFPPIKKIFLKPLDDSLAARQLRHLLQARGTLTCNLVSVASTVLCHAYLDEDAAETTTESFHIVEETDTAFVQDPVLDNVQSLEDKVNELTDKNEEDESSRSNISRVNAIRFFQIHCCSAKSS